MVPDAVLTNFDDLLLVDVPSQVTLPLPHPLSDLELMAFSRRNRPYRIEQNAAGELEVFQPLGFEDGRRELSVMSRLGSWAEECGGICFSSNVGVTLQDKSIRSPDASWISQARWDSLPKAGHDSFLPVCPEFLIEILLTQDSRVTIEARMEMWIANGAQLAWMIDPFTADVVIYRPGEKAERLTRPEWIEAEIVVPGFRLETSRLWAI